MAIKERKIALMGSRGVGKSSLSTQFTEKTFQTSYYPSIENFYSKIIPSKSGQEYNVEIVDAAGQDEFSVLDNKHFIGIAGYMLVYSVQTQDSFDMMSVVRDRIISILSMADPPIILVGNKNDLRPELRKITSEQGAALAKEFNCPFVETSAKDDKNVDEAFAALIEEIERREVPVEAKEPSVCPFM